MTRTRVLSAIFWAAIAVNVAAAGVNIAGVGVHLVAGTPLNATVPLLATVLALATLYTMIWADGRRKRDEVFFQSLLDEQRSRVAFARRVEQEVGLSVSVSAVVHSNDDDGGGSVQ